LKGLAIVALKYTMNAKMRARKSSTEVKLARFNNRRTKMLNQISTWFNHDVCLGV
jgi:hypothetical protein